MIPDSIASLQCNVEESFIYKGILHHEDHEGHEGLAEATNAVLRDLRVLRGEFGCGSAALRLCSALR